MLGSPSGRAGNERERKQVLEVLLKAWNQNPGERLGNLIIKAISQLDERDDKDIEHITDVALVEALLGYHRMNKG